MFDLISRPYFKTIFAMLSSMLVLKSCSLLLHCSSGPKETSIDYTLINTSPVAFIVKCLAEKKIDNFLTGI